jgi:type II secretory pathway pseudopilin PulG
MPGLIRTVARTAVIAGTATATSNAVNRRQAEKNVRAYSEAQQQYAQEAGAPASAVGVGAGPSPAVVVQQPAAPAPESMDEKLANLERLAQLKAQGILTEEEFAAQKARILAS